MQTQWQIKEESRQSQLDMIKLENKSLKETNELIKRESETLRESFEQSRRSAAVSSLQPDECLVKQEMLIQANKETDQLRSKYTALNKEYEALKLRVNSLEYETIRKEEKIKFLNDNLVQRNF